MHAIQQLKQLSSSKISNFERKLESIIKDAFKKSLNDEYELEIAADYQTHLRIEEIVKGLGLSIDGIDNKVERIHDHFQI